MLQVKDVFLPWYNAYRFLVQNVKRLDAEGLEPFKPLDRAVLRQSPNVLDRWINSASQSLVTFVRQEMEAYRLYTVSIINLPILTSIVREIIDSHPLRVNLASIDSFGVSCRLYQFCSNLLTI